MKPSEDSRMSQSQSGADKNFDLAAPDPSLNSPRNGVSDYSYRDESTSGPQSTEAKRDPKNLLSESASEQMQNIRNCNGFIHGRQFASTGLELSIDSKFGSGIILYEIGERNSQEDAIVICHDNNRIVFGVADGMGGEKGGQAASANVCEGLYSGLQSGASLKDACAAATQHVSAAQNDSAKDQPVLIVDGGSTTLSAISIDKSGEFEACYVGDSPIYVIRDGQVLLQLGEHTYLNKFCSFLENYDRKGEGVDFGDILRSLLPTNIFELTEKQRVTKQAADLLKSAIQSLPETSNFKDEKSQLRVLHKWTVLLSDNNLKDLSRIARNWLYGSQLTRKIESGLGSNNFDVVKSYFKLRPKDIIIVASDGMHTAPRIVTENNGDDRLSFTHFVTPELVARVVQRFKEPELIAQALKKLCRSGGSTDNLALIAFEYNFQESFEDRRFR